MSEYDKNEYLKDSDKLRIENAFWTRLWLSIFAIVGVTAISTALIFTNHERRMAKLGYVERPTPSFQGRHWEKAVPE